MCAPLERGGGQGGGKDINIRTDKNMEVHYVHATTHG